MYLSGGNTTTKALLSPAENYVIGSAHLRSSGCTRQNQAEQPEINEYYVIMRASLVHKSIYDHLTRIVTVDEIINANASKAPWKANK